MWSSPCLVSLLLALCFICDSTSVKSPFSLGRYQKVMEVFALVPEFQMPLRASSFLSPASIIMQPVPVSKQSGQSDQAHPPAHCNSTQQSLLQHSAQMALARLCLNRALAGRAQALARPAVASSHGGMDLRSLFSSERAESTGMAPLEGKTSCREVAVADRSSSTAASHWPWRDLRLRDLVPFRLVDDTNCSSYQTN